MNKNSTKIGVYVDFQTTSTQLHNVLYHLHLNAAEVKDTTLLLLLDQPNEQLRQTIQQLPYLVIELTTQQSGHVYYFNQLN